MIAFILAVSSTIDPGSIASNHASYDGSALYLEGEVSLQHGFGTMKAEKAVLTREEEQEEFPFTHIELSDGVKLALSTDAHMECEKAAFDFSTLQAALTSSKQVHYTDWIRKEGRATFFELLTPHLDLQLSKDPQGTYDIKQGHARQGVHLTYDRLYHLQTESVLYSKSEAATHLASDGISPCVWTYQNDQIDAAQFDLNLTDQELHLKQSAGSLASFSKGTLQFSAHDLLWKQADNHLLLQGTPHIQESSLGAITSDTEIDLTLRDHTVHHLKTTGLTTLTSLKGHRLKTQGTLEIDGEHHLATVRSSTPDTQLLYEEEEMTLCADEAQIHYRQDDQGLHPALLELQGRITIFSQEKEGPSRRGIADLLTYDPNTRTCILKALPGQKVLFTRDQDELRISSPEVHITYNPVSKEQEIRGIGHVVFSLTPEEQHCLNQVFSHVPPTP